MAGTYFIRHAKERNYTVLDNTFLKDTRLSWKAKGLFAYILSLPEDWKIYISDLQERAADGETSVRSAVKELTEYGYIMQRREKDDKGRWAAYSYIIIENPNDTQGEIPLVENPNVDKPNVENHVLINTNNTKYENKENTNSLAQKSLVGKNNRKTKKASDIVTMRNMVSEFSQDDDIRIKLLEYFTFRLKTGLQPNQWQIILNDLKAYSRNKEVILEKINNALAGGYRQIIAPWEKGNSGRNANAKFDNTANNAMPKAVANMSESEKQEFDKSLARDDSGNLITF